MLFGNLVAALSVLIAMTPQTFDGCKTNILSYQCIFFQKYNAHNLTLRVSLLWIFRISFFYVWFYIFFKFKKNNFGTYFLKFYCILNYKVFFLPYPLSPSPPEKKKEIQKKKQKKSNIFLPLPPNHPNPQRKKPNF